MLICTTTTLSGCFWLRGFVLLCSEITDISDVQCAWSVVGITGWIFTPKHVNITVFVPNLIALEIV